MVAAAAVDSAAAAVGAVAVAIGGSAGVLAVAVVIAEAHAELTPLATAVGEAWAAELLRMLRANKRELVGAWPGTLREARMRILARVRRSLDLALLDDLARVANVTARREWQQVSQPDPES